MTTDAIRLRRARVAIYGPVVTGGFGVLLLVAGAFGFTRTQFKDATTHTQPKTATGAPDPGSGAGPGGAPGQGSISAPTEGRFLLVGADAQEYATGDLAHPRAGTSGAAPLNLGGRRIVAATVAASGGTWLATADAHVFAVNAPDLGGVVLAHGAAPIVGIASAVGGEGYRLVSADGHVYAVGAPTRGNGLLDTTAPGTRASPVVGIATAANDGYWIARADGTVAAVGAPVRGQLRLAQNAARVVGISATLDGAGYWLTTADGHVHAFGAPFRGDLTSRRIHARVVAIAPSAMDGYWLTTAAGQVYAFGAPTFGTPTSTKPRAPIVAVVPY